MTGGELAQCPANEFFPVAAFAGLDAVVDQLKLLLVQAKPNRRVGHGNHPAQGGIAPPGREAHYNHRLRSPAFRRLHTRLVD